MLQHHPWFTLPRRRSPPTMTSLSSLLGSLDRDSFIPLLSKIISESHLVQNNPSDLVPQEDLIARHVLDVLSPSAPPPAASPSSSPTSPTPSAGVLRRRIKAQSRPTFSPRRVNEHSYDRAARGGLRYKEPENINSSQRHRHDELPDAWSNQSVEKHILGHLKYPHSDKEANKRTPEGISAYVKLCEVNKRKKRLLNGEHILEKGSSMSSRIVSEANKSVKEERLFLPEMMLPWNCVPESALPATDEFMENLPPVMSMSPAMIERFGITPENVKMSAKYRGKDGSGGQRISLSQERAKRMTQKVVARVLSSSGFEAGNETSMEVFSEIINNHICKLGRTLKILTDSYRKQFSAIELLRMFLQATGHIELIILN